jgi:hypothetical protein
VTRVAALVMAALACAGCRPKDRLAPVEFEAPKAAPVVDAEATLAPAWPAPTRAQLDNGALLHWLHEPGSTGFHLRILLPGPRLDDDVDAVAFAVVTNAARTELERRLRTVGTRVELTHRPGRAEISLHGSADDAMRTIGAVTAVFADRRPEHMLAQAKERMVAARRRADPRAPALAAAVASALGSGALEDHVPGAAVAERSSGALVRAWPRVLDPRRAVLVVHSGKTAPELADPVGRLAGTWVPRGSGRRDVDLFTRLRAPAGKRPRTRLIAAPAAPLQVVAPAPGASPEIVLARAIATPNATERALVRLCQRLLQEELDARLAVAGPVSVLVVRAPLSRRDPTQSVRGVIEAIGRFADTEHQPERLDQAARLWLGARIVEASLAGEDWTTLWSESIDLADRESEVGTALSADARAMLEAKPEQVRAFQQRWLLPGAGEPGWVWVGSGLDAATTARLGEITRLERLP